MLIYVLRWWPSGISVRHKKHTPCRGSSNDHSKLYMNVHWMVLYVFCSDMKFKMAATAEHWTLWEKCFKMLLLWNHLDNWNQTAQEWSLDGPLQGVCFLCRSEIQDGHHGFNHICSFWEEGICTFPLGFNVNLCPAVVAILDFRLA
jgi:hypothetical protein